MMSILTSASLLCFLLLSIHIFLTFHLLLLASSLISLYIIVIILMYLPLYSGSIVEQATHFCSSQNIQHVTIQIEEGDCFSGDC